MIEYLIVLYEYYKTCRLSYLLYNLITALLAGSAIFFVSNHKGFIQTANGLTSNFVSVLGILVGFSISMFTLLNTASNPNIETIKTIETENKLYSKPVYLFDLLLISMIYIIIFESILLIANILFPFFFLLDNLTGKVAFCIDVFLLIHVILVNVSTTVDFYFVITKKR